MQFVLVDYFHPHLIRFSESEWVLGEFNLLSVDFSYLLHEQNIIIINQKKTQLKRLEMVRIFYSACEIGNAASTMQHFIFTLK